MLIIRLLYSYEGTCYSQKCILTAKLKSIFDRSTSLIIIKKERQWMEKEGVLSWLLTTGSLCKAISHQMQMNGTTLELIKTFQNAMLW